MPELSWYAVLSDKSTFPAGVPRVPPDSDRLHVREGRLRPVVQAVRALIPHARISSLYLVVQVVQGVYKARPTRANACTTYKSPRGTSLLKNSSNPRLTRGNRCTTSSGTPPDTPRGYIGSLLQPDPISGGSRPAGRKNSPDPEQEVGRLTPPAGECSSTRRQRLRGAYAPGAAVSHSRPHALVVSLWPSGLARDPSEPRPGIIRDLCRTTSQLSVDSLRKTIRMA